MILRLSRLVSLLLVGLAASSAAPAPAAAPTAAPAPAWPLPPLDYFIHKLPPPPRPGSWRDRMDLSDVVARQQMVTQADLKPIFDSFEVVLTRFTLLEFGKIEKCSATFTA